jgi:hypothetical protein
MPGIANVENDERHAMPKSGRALCLLLFALAWFQLSYASHQFEHVAGDLTGACAVCTQLERLDTAAFHEPAEVLVSAAVPVAVAVQGGEVLPVPVRRYESRAPPAT